MSESEGSHSGEEYQINTANRLIEDTSRPETYHPAYKYYVQNEKGQTDLWDTMIKNIKPTGKKELRGGFFKDGTISWTNEDTTHTKLINESKKHAKEDDECQFTFECRYLESDDKPTLYINTYEKAYIDRFMKYLAKSISSDTPIKVKAIMLTDEELNGRKLTKICDLDLNTYREQQ